MKTKTRTLGGSRVSKRGPVKFLGKIWVFGGPKSIHYTVIHPIEKGKGGGALENLDLSRVNVQYEPYLQHLFPREINNIIGYSNKLLLHGPLFS